MDSDTKIQQPAAKIIAPWEVKGYHRRIYLADPSNPNSPFLLCTCFTAEAVAAVITVLFAEDATCLHDVIVRSHYVS
jgi:hypothetical protein